MASGHPDVTVPWRLAMARVDAGHTGTVGPIPRWRLGSHKLDELVCHRCVEPAGAVALDRHDSLATRLGSCCPFLAARFLLPHHSAFLPLDATVRTCHSCAIFPPSSLPPAPRLHPLPWTMSTGLAMSSGSSRLLQPDQSAGRPSCKSCSGV